MDRGNQSLYHYTLIFYLLVVGGGCFLFVCLSLSLASWKTRQTEEEVGRQHLGMDRPGVCQVPEGSREQGKMEETGCEIICGAPTTLAVKG